MLRQPLPIQKYGSQRVQFPLFHDNYPNRAPQDYRSPLHSPTRDLPLYPLHHHLPPLHPAVTCGPSFYCPPPGQREQPEPSTARGTEMMRQTHCLGPCPAHATTAGGYSPEEVGPTDCRNAYHCAGGGLSPTSACKGFEKHSRDGAASVQRTPADRGHQTAFARGGNRTHWAGGGSGGRRGAAGGGGGRAIRQLLGAADAETAHPATSSTAPAHQPLGSANAATTPAGAPAAAADRTQRPDTCEGKNG